MLASALTTNTTEIEPWSRAIDTGCSVSKVKVNFVFVFVPAVFGPPWHC